MNQAYVARLHLGAAAKRTLEEGVRENGINWQEALTRPRMETDHFKYLLHEVAQLAITKRLVRLEGRFYT
jgi:hypothetical protein